MTHIGIAISETNKIKQIQDKASADKDVKK